jgi:predicted ATP-grasp superfamily ATP-dependent carboligase
MAEPPCLLIAAASGRALAVAARRAGYRPLVADCYGDLDTIAAAHRHIPLARNDDGRLAADAVLAALQALAATDNKRAIGVVYGTGFEAAPEILRAIAVHWTLLGNDADTVACLKDPLYFAHLCRLSDIPHPETTVHLPAPPGGWLRKQRGGSGGVHVRSLSPQDHADGNIYFQRRDRGRSVSLSFLATGKDIAAVGFSEQWIAPVKDRPYRYGGAAQPAALSAGDAATLTDAILRLAQHVHLKGLNSADFLVRNDGYVLLEINPRAGSTLDIFGGWVLFEAHIAACRGDPLRWQHRPGARAAAVVYANQDIAALPRWQWPVWSAGRQRSGSRLAAGDPLCTVFAAGACLAAAREKVDRRAATVLRWAQGQCQ